LADIFLSYSHEDVATARRFAKAFERAGFSVWWDRTLHSGDPYDRITEKALKEAAAVVVLWSKKSVESRWVRSEATIAYRHRTLAPVSIEPCERPIMFELSHTVDLTHWNGDPNDKSWKSYLSDVRRFVDDRKANPGELAQLEETDTALVGGGAPRVDRRALIGGAIALALAGGGFTAWKTGLFGPAAPERNSIAVLPFTNLSGDPDQNYLSDGLAAEIRAELSRNSSLQVVAQTSSNVFRDNKSDAKQIARQLSVVFLLDGNVRRSGDTLRIVTELINGRTGFSTWSQTFERSYSNLLDVQSEIAQAVVQALSVEVAATNAAQGARPDRLGTTKSVAAYEAFMRGNRLYSLATGEAEDREAAAAYGQAIALDANFGAAHAARARALTVIANQFVQNPERRELYEEAIKSANLAVDLAPDLADAHSALGLALSSGRLDIRGARVPYDRSYELGKGDADVLSRFATFCARTGRFDDARAAIRRAQELDPLNALVLRTMGTVAYADRRYAESIPPLERALVLNPGLIGARSNIGASLLLLGQVEEARRSFALDQGGLFGQVGLAVIARKQQKPAEAEAALARLIADHGDNSLYQQAEIFAQWGDSGRAIELLKRARAANDAGLVYMRNDPFLDPIRTDAEFQRLLDELGFTRE
jgi:TolB-like protein/Flp pilus assembly protein TadD